MQFLEQFKNKPEIIKHDVVINDTVYSIRLLSKGSKGCYELSFTANDGNYIINKGIKQFYLLVDEIAKIIVDLQKAKELREITFTATMESIEQDTILRIQQQLLEKFNENPAFLEGFHLDAEHEKINIKDGIVTVWVNKYPSGFKTWLGKESEFIAQPNTTVDHVLHSPSELPFHLLSVIHLSELINYTGINVSKEDQDNINDQTSDKAAQRSSLYQRILERKFPGIPFERKDNTFKIIFDKKVA